MMEQKLEKLIHSCWTWNDINVAASNAFKIIPDCVNNFIKDIYLIINGSALSFSKFEIFKRIF